MRRLIVLVVSFFYFLPDLFADDVGIDHAVVTIDTTLNGGNDTSGGSTKGSGNIAKKRR